MKNEKQSYLTVVIDSGKIGVALCPFAESEIKNKSHSVKVERRIPTTVKVNHKEIMTRKLITKQTPTTVLQVKYVAKTILITYRKYTALRKLEKFTNIEICFKG